MSTDWNQPMPPREPLGPPRSEPPGWRPRRRRVGLVLLLAAAGVVIALLVVEGPREIARWHEAASAEATLDGRYEQAVRHLDRAIAWDPNNYRLYLARARAKRRAGRLQGSLADCDRAVQLAPDEIPPYVHRSQLLLIMGKGPDAIRDAEQVARLSRDISPLAHAVAMNMVAYYRAVANIELAKALREIEHALATLGPDEALLDTRGYVLYRMGDYEAARKDLDRAVRLAERRYQQQYGDLERARHEAFDLRLFELERISQARNVAVLHYHRALNLQALGKEKEAQRDLKRVRDLGFEPNDQLF